jgi:hypothetical protein
MTPMLPQLKKTPKKVYIFFKKYEWIVYVIFYEHADSTNTYITHNKNDKLLTSNGSRLEMNSYNPRFYVFCCTLHEYLLNLKICMLIEDNVSYTLIFFY